MHCKLSEWSKAIAANENVAPATRGRSALPSDEARAAYRAPYWATLVAAVLLTSVVSAVLSANAAAADGTGANGQEQPAQTKQRTSASDSLHGLTPRTQTGLTPRKQDGLTPKASDHAGKEIVEADCSVLSSDTQKIIKSEVASLRNKYGDERLILRYCGGEESHIDAPDEAIYLNCVNLKMYMDGAKTNDAADAIRFVLGHEYTHLLQYANDPASFKGLAEHEDNRLWECQADILGSRYAHAKMYSDFASLNDEAPERVDERLRQLTQFMQQLESPPNDTYPSLKQRIQAMKQGELWTYSDLARTELQHKNPALTVGKLREITDFTARCLDLRQDEGSDARRASLQWSERAARRIIGYKLGDSGCIREVKTDLHPLAPRTRTLDSGFEIARIPYAYSITYQYVPLPSRGRTRVPTRPLSIDLQLDWTAIPSDAPDGSETVFQDRRFHTLVLQPGEQRTVSGIVEITPDASSPLQLHAAPQNLLDASAEAARALVAHLTVDHKTFLSATYPDDNQAAPHGNAVPVTGKAAPKTPPFPIASGKSPTASTGAMSHHAPADSAGAGRYRIRPALEGDGYVVEWHSAGHEARSYKGSASPVVIRPGARYAVQGAKTIPAGKRFSLRHGHILSGVRFLSTMTQGRWHPSKTSGKR